MVLQVLAEDPKIQEEMDSWPQKYLDILDLVPLIIIVSNSVALMK